MTDDRINQILAMVAGESLEVDRAFACDYCKYGRREVEPTFEEIADLYYDPSKARFYCDLLGKEEVDRRTKICQMEPRHGTVWGTKALCDNEDWVFKEVKTAIEELVAEVRRLKETAL